MENITQERKLRNCALCLQEIIRIENEKELRFRNRLKYLRKDKLASLVNVRTIKKSCQLKDDDFIHYSSGKIKNIGHCFYIDTIRRSFHCSQEMRKNLEVGKEI